MKQNFSMTNTTEKMLMRLLHDKGSNKKHKLMEMGCKGEKMTYVEEGIEKYSSSDSKDECSSKSGWGLF